jgi:hypothetical protein
MTVKEMGPVRATAPALPPERRAEVPWLFIRQQTGTGVLVCCTIPSSSRPLSENDEAEIKSARERLARLHENGDLPCRRGLVLAPVRSPTRADQHRARMATGTDCAASGVSGANALSE